jgi:hypothetical protein
VPVRLRWSSRQAVVRESVDIDILIGEADRLGQGADVREPA